MTYLKFKKPRITCIFDVEAKSNISLQKVVKELFDNNILYLLFDKISKELEDKVPPSGAFIQGDIEYEHLIINGYEVKTIKFQTYIKPVIVKALVPHVVYYGEPLVPSTQRNVIIETIDLGNTQVIKNTSNVLIEVDMSNIKSPPNSHFLHIVFDLKRLVSGRINTIGIKAPPITLKDKGMLVSYTN